MGALSILCGATFACAGIVALGIALHELRLVHSHIRKLKTDLRNLKDIDHV